MSFFGDLFKSNKPEYGFAPDPKFHKAPEHAETTAARKGAGRKLTAWGEDPNYGAISPNWDDIWGKAHRRIKESYWGGPSGAGEIGKVRSSAAARGVSESPALETQISRMGMKEGQETADLATDMAREEAEFGEAGRLNWFDRMMKMAGLEVPGMWQKAQDMTPTQSPVWGALGKLAGPAMSLLGGGGDTDWLSKLLPMAGGATGTMFGGPAGGMAGGAAGNWLGSLSQPEPKEYGWGGGFDNM